LTHQDKLLEEGGAEELKRLNLKQNLLRIKPSLKRRKEHKNSSKKRPLKQPKRLNRLN